MNQAVITFSNSTARGSAIASPVEGMLTYLEDTQTYESWDGAAWVAFGGSAGLTKISSTSFTAVSIVTIDNVFTSEFENYRILFYATAAGAPGFTFIKFRSGGVTNTSSNYIDARLRMNSTGVLSAGEIIKTATQSNVVVDNTAGSRIATIDLFGPQLAKETLGAGSFIGIGGSFMGWTYPGFNTSDQFDGFSINQETSTFTGKIDVYGYRS